jgi:hypothetical protein
MTFMIDDKTMCMSKISSENLTRIRANPSWGGTINNHFKKWLKNQKQPNFGPFLLYVFNCML